MVLGSILYRDENDKLTTREHVIIIDSDLPDGILGINPGDGLEVSSIVKYLNMEMQKMSPTYILQINKP